MNSRTGRWLSGRRRAGAPGAHARISPGAAARRLAARLTARWSVAVLALSLVGGMLALAVPMSTATAAVLGPGRATIPGFVGYVTSSNTELGIGRLPNGSYGVCTDTGAQFPWPDNPTVTQATSPETAYLLTHFMDDAIGNPRMAAALWWATGLTLGQNSQPAAMQTRIAEMRAEAPGIYNDVKALHDRMVSQANRWAAPAGGYTASINVANDGAADRVEVRQIGVRSGSAWVPDEKITVTLEGATFNSTGTSTWTGRTEDAPLTLAARQSGPGVVKATIRATNLANTTYRRWWGGGNTQRVLARGDYDTATASDETLDDTAVARAKKVDAETGEPLAGAVFRAWVDVNGNQTEEPTELGRDLAPTGSGGFTSRVNAYRGTSVCFREKTAPAGYIRDRTVKCIAAAPDGDPVAVLEIANESGIDGGSFVPLIVRKYAEGGDPAGMIGVHVEVAECPECPAIEWHTFTEADYDPANAYVQFTFSPRYNADATYWVRIMSEPAGWTAEAFQVQAQLLPDASFFYAQLQDVRLPVPQLVTQISDQDITVGATITDAVTVTGTGGATINGYWRLYGPMPALVGEDGDPTCVGVDWSGAPLAAQGDFLIDRGDGTYEGVGSYTVEEAGCFTYSEAGDPTSTTGPIPWTAPGIPEETTLARHEPTLVTQISAQDIKVGTTVTDAVKVTGTGGATVTGVWRLLGPMPALANDKGAPTCVGVDWSKAAVAAEGEFTATGDGTYTVGEHTITVAGCYTYVEDLKGTTTTYPMPETPPGIPEETTLVRDTPTLVTQISAQMGAPGITVTDAVTVTGTGGATVTGVWRLLGPVTPLMGPVGQTCEGVDWSKAAVAAEGEFTATGDGTYTVGEHTIAKAGCYTYVEDLKGTTSTFPMPETPPGIPSETTLITDGPTIVTQISDQRVEIGEEVTDTVVVEGTGFAQGETSIAAKWWLYGPLEPKMKDGKASCRDLDWTGVKIAAEGEFTVTGDGTYEGVGPFTIPDKKGAAGCYSYKEALLETATTEPVETLVGIHAETTLASVPSEDQGSADDGRDASSEDVGHDAPVLPSTGSTRLMAIAVPVGVVLLAGGLLLAWASRRRTGADQDVAPGRWSPS